MNQLRYDSAQVLESQHVNSGKYELLVVAHDAYDLGCYLVNNSGHSLRQVISGSGGCITTDDEAIPLSSKDKIYKNVKESEAVLIDVFNIVYDSDGILQFNIFIQEDQDTSFTLRLLAAKPPNNMVLIDKNGAPHKYVGVYDE